MTRRSSSEGTPDDPAACPALSPKVAAGFGGIGAAREKPRAGWAEAAARWGPERVDIETPSQFDISEWNW